MPGLDVFGREGIANGRCVVTRYFGGVLLGAGGQVRAYAKAAKLGLDAAGRSCKRVWSTIDIPCPYHLFERVKLLVQQEDGMLGEIEYGADVLLHTLFPQSKEADFLAALTDLTNGAVSGIVTDQIYRAFPVDET